MCTAISYIGAKGHYFGRNLDLTFCYQEQVTVTPRNYGFRFRTGYGFRHHYAMLGMATVANGYPLYYEATNELGLSMAGLNFPDNAQYQHKLIGKQNIAPFELIPWILGQCANVREAKSVLQNVNIWNLPFSREFGLTPLHWLISDGEDSIVAEPMEDGLKIYDNPFGILTNNPPLPYHLTNLSNYIGLSPSQAENTFSKKKLVPYSNGMGAMGLPGDYSSASRFIKAAFVKENAVSCGDDVGQFFHILGSVAMPRGNVKIGELDEITQYSCCCDTKRGIYYYTTYENSRITAVKLWDCPLLSDQLITYPLRKAEDIRFEN